MVSLIKNQLLKHLSRFVKDLSPDKINVSAFRGEGDLSNLQLNEDVLTELLELPSWIRLTSAWCNHVSFRISWTKLKSVPITLSLDEVNITIETCEFGRNENSGAGGWQSLTAPKGKYNFIDKIIDGITVTINTVNINFKSPAFIASVQMSRIRVESKTPKWLSGDLRVTRLKDTVNGHLLIFKELSWQTVRIEASSTQDKSLTPLRLLTNEARCRITIKKKLVDCTILASRLVLVLDDLLWVLTDSQLNAALHFVDSLASLIKTSTNLTQKTKAKKILEQLPEYQAQIAQQSRQQQNTNEANSVISAAQRSFNMFDVKETSYHFSSQRIDLHLCDDAGNGRSCYPDLCDGGALQISIHGFQVDYFPFHLAKYNRAHWPKYKEAAVPPALWLEQSLNAFRESLLNLCQPNRPPTHAPLERTSPQNTASNESFTNMNKPSAAQAASTKQILDNFNKLMTACVVLRIENFMLYRVTTSGKKSMPKEFISGDRERYSIPDDLSTLHAEFTYFYFPGDFDFPLPPSKVFVHVNPVQINFHLDSILWLNSFALNLHENLLRTSMNAANEESNQNRNEPSLMYMDVKMEAIMPRILIESTIDAPNQRDRPKTMQIQVSRFALTNIRETGSSRADLANALHSLQEGTLVFASDFPSKTDDLSVVTDRILAHMAASDMMSNKSSPNSASANTTITTPTLTKYALWIEPRDVWCIKLDPIWIEFLGARSVGQNKAVPFVDAVPITFWIHGKSSAKLNPTLNSLAAQSMSSINQKCQDTGYMSDDRNSNTDNFAYNSDFLSQQNYAQTNPFFSMPSEDHTSDSDSTTIHARTAKASVTSTAEDISADLHIIAHVSNLISVQVDHYQYLFLLRIAEEFTELSTFLTVDSKRILKEEDESKSIVIACVIPQVEVTLVMPSQTPGKESNGGDGESVLPDSASLGDDLHFNSNSVNAANWPLTLDQMKNHQNTNTFGSIETPSPVTNEAPDAIYQQFEQTQPIQYTSSPNTHGFNVQIVGTSSSNTTSTSTPQSSTTPVSRGKNRNSITDSGLNIGSSLISMKKGFSSFMTSIDSALKTNMSDDMSDTISIQSDISSDSENYVMVLADDKTADCMDVMFRLNPFNTDGTAAKANTVEVASEVCEELDYKTNMSSPSEPSEASTWRRRDLVSMATFRLTMVEIIRQNRGPISAIRVQVSAVSCDECGAIPWDEFQTKFGARCRAWNIAQFNQESPPTIRLRLDDELKVPDITDGFTVKDKKEVLGWFNHKLEARCKDLSLALSMSTVIGLNDLAEDEIISKPLPMEILLENLKITLIEDRPPVNITSPGSVPINLQIGHMRVKRNEMGIFEIQPYDSINDGTQINTIIPMDTEKSKRERDRELISLQLVMQQLKIDNDSLKKQLNLIEQSSEANTSKARQESDVLKSYLKKAQDDILVLLDEKRKLLDTVRNLQQQLVSKDHNLKNDGSR
ncbi:bridge-like lipid transfer protein family member 3B isoform X2 [Sitodiplosis mosellana]|uniref:bridge-like lipid transfer protein family member 3B isoform X2 n=1 Tax=Sitodiplosis mosellana TaxID=263140 RepID=UPI002444E4F7|nr:bridge-like lipid transfer protein family member 3B isoform X2 [Sitodiplosis mosellana]